MDYMDEGKADAEAEELMRSLQKELMEAVEWLILSKGKRPSEAVKLILETENATDLSFDELIEPWKEGEE